MVVTGGLRLGITMARPAQRAVAGTSAAKESPSRRWRCQSSGRGMVIVFAMAAGVDRLGDDWKAAAGALCSAMDERMR